MWNKTFRDLLSRSQRGKEGAKDLTGVENFLSAVMWEGILTFELNELILCNLEWHRVSLRLVQKYVPIFVLRGRRQNLEPPFWTHNNENKTKDLYAYMVRTTILDPHRSSEEKLSSFQFLFFSFIFLFFVSQLLHYFSQNFLGISSPAILFWFPPSWLYHWPVPAKESRHQMHPHKSMHAR